MENKNSNSCSNEKINEIKQNIANYKALYTKYLTDKTEIDKQKENIRSLLDEQFVKLQNNLILKNQEVLSINCNIDNTFKECYLKCKEKNNPKDRKPDVFVTTNCSKEKDADGKNIDNCVCYFPDYEKIDTSIDEINDLLKKKLKILEAQNKLNKPEDLVYDDPCCTTQIVCKDGVCTDVDIFCKSNSSVVEPFTTHNEGRININHILIFVIIILMIFFLCKK